MFVTLIASSVPEHLHGYISRFLTEVNTGVYVGKVTPRVADSIWERSESVAGEGLLTMIQSSPDFEQGFSVRSHCPGQRRVRCLDGIWLGEMVQNDESAW